MPIERMASCPACGQSVVIIADDRDIVLRRLHVPVPRLSAAAFTAQLAWIISPANQWSAWECSKMLQEQLTLLDHQALDERLFQTTRETIEALHDPLWEADALVTLAHYAPQPALTHAVFGAALTRLQQVELAGDQDPIFLEVLRDLLASISLPGDREYPLEARPLRQALRTQARTTLLPRVPEAVEALQALLDGRPSGFDR